MNKNVQSKKVRNKKMNNKPVLSNQLPQVNNTSLVCINKEQPEDSRLVAVIVTITSGSSYDNLFSTVQQKSEEGTHVLVYKCPAAHIGEIVKAFNDESKDETTKQLVENIKNLQNDCTVFNWECCSGYAPQNFPQGKDMVMDMLAILIERGHMAMFSDFALKALIQNWNYKVLGPKCLVKTGEFTGQATLRFQPGVLMECPSTQLQSVGELSQGGIVNIQAAGGTIVYSVDHTKTDHQFYKVQILTVATSSPATCKEYLAKINQYQGNAGHVLITYPSKGMILTSMGHWVELVKIDVSEQKLFDKAQEDYGEEYAKNMKMQYAMMNQQGEKQAWVQKNAQQFVQNRAPCNNVQRKRKQAEKKLKQ